MQTNKHSVCSYWLHFLTTKNSTENNSMNRTAIKLATVEAKQYNILNFFTTKIERNHWKPGKMTDTGECSSAWRLSTCGMVVTLVDRLLPWQVVCDTHGQAWSGSVSSTAHSSTAGMWHWHRRMVQTCLHTVHLGIHHTAGRQEHTALPPPSQMHINCDYDQSIHLFSEIIADIWKMTTKLYPLV